MASHADARDIAFQVVKDAWANAQDVLGNDLNLDPANLRFQNWLPVDPPNDAHWGLCYMTGVSREPRSQGDAHNPNRVFQYNCNLEIILHAPFATGMAMLDDIAVWLMDAFDEWLPGPTYDALVRTPRATSHDVSFIDVFPREQSVTRDGRWFRTTLIGTLSYIRIK